MAVGFLLRRDTQLQQLRVLLRRYRACLGETDAEIEAVVRAVVKENGYENGNVVSEDPLIVQSVDVRIITNLVNPFDYQKRIEVKVWSGVVPAFIQLVYHGPLAAQGWAVGQCSMVVKTDNLVLTGVLPVQTQ
jgi:hypothetical protein